jgi:hypothetical protein
MISFFMRARDEERVIGGCLSSLERVTGAQIVVCLDRCQDWTTNIVRERQQKLPERYKVFENHDPVSRAGLETLCTPAQSPRSLATFMTNIHNVCDQPWSFHVGADFILSAELIDFLNSGALKAFKGKLTALRIPCVAPIDGIRNCELYLSNCLVAFGKHVFWEVPLFPGHMKEFPIREEIRHMSRLAVMKPYWNDKPWFQYPIAINDTEALSIRAKYDYASTILGPEPRGVARGSNPECTPYERRVHESRELLESRGISFFA